MALLAPATSQWRAVLHSWQDLHWAKACLRDIPLLCRMLANATDVEQPCVSDTKVNLKSALWHQAVAFKYAYAHLGSAVAPESVCTPDKR